MAATFVAASSVVGGSSTITPSLPTGTEIGDVVFIYTGSRSNNRTLATPADWTLVATDNRTRCFARRRDSAWSMPPIAWTGGDSASGSAVAWSIRGLKQAGSIADIVVAPELPITPAVPSNQAGLYFPDLTLSSGFDLFVQALDRWESTSDTNGFDSSFFSAPAGWTTGFAGKGQSGNSISLAGFYQQQVGAASSTSAETITVTPPEDPATITRAFTFAMETEPAASFALTLGSDTVEAGGAVTASVSPAFDGDINGAAFGTTDALAVSAASESAATLTVPGIEEFRAGGDAANTPLAEALDVTVTDGTDTSEADALTIAVPTGWYLVTVDTAYASLSAAAKEWAHASTAIGNKYLIGGTNVVGVTDDLEIGFGPGSTEFTHVRWDGSAWGTAGTYDFDEDVPQVLTTDAVEYVAGGTIACTIAPASAATPSTATLGGASVVVSSATTAGCSVAIPAVAEFLPTGDMEAVPFGSFVELVVTMSDASTLSAFVLIAPSADANSSGSTYWYRSVSDQQAGSGIFASFNEGDGYLAIVTSGGIASITQDGAVIALEDGAADFYRFVAAWVAQTDITFDYVPPSLIGGVSSSTNTNAVYSPLLGAVR